ncbi:MAG: amidohydrolase family protein [Fimbriimonadales bacterium]|nr:amidohydrolase family protein [Fimbriimonadales bacterium]
MKVVFLRDNTQLNAEFDPDRRTLQIDRSEHAEITTNSNCLVPGLIDSHCHGVDGMDVMEGKAKQIGANLRSRGIEYYCPTTVTAKWSEIRHALEPCKDRFPGFAGVHLEGPFINPNRSGAQPSDQIEQPDYQKLANELGELLDLVKIVTLAPELNGSRQLISELRNRRIAVSAGHTDATSKQLHEHKIDRITHFYNAMRPFHHRDPGPIGYGLTENVTLEIIYDRIHVSAEALQIALRCQQENGCVIAVSDGTALSGQPDGTACEMWGHRVSMRQGAVRLENGTLAGSAATLADVFRNIWQDEGPSAAVEACSEAPRKALGLPEPRLWLLVDAEGNIIKVFEMDLAIS